jgi:hypothetical protein
MEENCRMHAGNEKLIQNRWKTSEMMPLGRLKRRWEDNKMDRREI